MSALQNHSTDYLTSKFRNSRIGRTTYTNALSSIVINEGGYVGGLVNEGNSCFMNSVLQSLASSKELMEFLDERIINSQEPTESDEEEDDDDQDDEQQSKEDDVTSDVDTIKQEHLEENTKSKENESKSSTKKVVKRKYGKMKKKLNKFKDEQLLGKSDSSERKTGEADVTFSIALKDLLDKLNAKHYNSRPNFRTNKLLRTMTKKPNSNVILGYDQEDAQEFFQTLLNELEKNVKSVAAASQGSEDSSASSTSGSNGTPEPVSIDSIPENALEEQEEDLDRVGTVYIPTSQIDPNIKDTKLYTPFKLVTPLDGITCERIGCLECGENGGIRYSIFSGLSLNLPGEKFGVTLKLSELMNEWSKPEIIEGVNCNRCGLLAVKDYLLEEIKKKSGTLPDKLLNAYKDRLMQVEELLSKSVIDDEDYQKFKISNMVQKSSKSKQILLSRPPALLAVHINRSCFDPRTYTIRKNNSRVVFKKKLNLLPWICKPDEINLDARLPMSKKHEGSKQQFEISSSEDEKVEKYYKKLHKTFEREYQDSDEEDDDGDEDEEDGDDDEQKYNHKYNSLNGNHHGNRAFPDSSDSDSDDDDDIESEIFEKPVDSLGNTISSSDESADVEDVDDDNDRLVALDDLKNQTSGSEARFGEEKHKRLQNEQQEQQAAGGDLSEEEEEEEEEEEADMVPLPTLKSMSTNVPDGPFSYNLRSVIVHYGTHNYGHYIAFRRFRGCWWRISDENAYVVDEKEVLSTPGVFMLFYEYDYDPETGMLKDDLETARLERELEIELEKEQKIHFQMQDSNKQNLDKQETADATESQQ
ncbi:hypothetical protein ACO0RG_001241 [Hanseniaspora osmophila]